MKLLVILLCANALLCAGHGVIHMSDASASINFREFVFSSPFCPDEVTFSYLKHINFCSSQVIDTYKERSPPGAIVLGGECAVYDQLLKIQNSGYKYVIFLEMEQMNENDYNVNHKKTLRQLSLFAAVVKYDDWAEHVLSPYGSNVPLELRGRLELNHQNEFISICHDRLQIAIHQELYSLITDFTYRCIQQAIEHTKGTTLSTAQVQVSVQLAQTLWEQNIIDAARLLTRWLTREMLARTRTQQPIHTSRYHNSTQYSMLIAARLEFVRVLVAIGDWDAASRILTQQIDALCMEGNRPMTSALCELSCGTVFVTAFSTLSIVPVLPSEPLWRDRPGAEFHDDWAITIEETTKTDTQQSHQVSLSAIDVCLDVLQESLQRGGPDTHEVWLQTMREQFADHSSLWLGTTELLFTSNKYGLLNVIRFVRAVMLLPLSLLDTDEPGQLHTQHIGYFLSLLHDTATCKWHNDTTRYTTWCEDSDIFHFSDMPSSSQSILRRNVKLGRAKSKHASLLHHAALEHVHNDMTSIFAKLGVYWDEYGSFSTAQTFFSARLAIIMCKYVATSRGKSTGNHHIIRDLSHCDMADGDLIRQVSAMGCLFSRSLMSIPVIFSDSHEYASYRVAQVTGVSKLHDMLSPFLTQREVLVTSNIEQALYPATVIADLKDRYSLMRQDKLITSTPAGMMQGYQYQLQDMGDVAQAPSSPVPPSFMRVLETGNHIEQMCETSFEQTPPMVSRPSNQPTPQDDRVQVGFISRFFYDHSVGRLISGVIVGLNRSLFNVKLFCLCCESYDDNDTIRNLLKQSPNLEWIDITSASGGSPSDGPFGCMNDYYSEPRLMEVALEQIRSTHLDVLVYPEIGMDHMTMSFAMFRLAPVQAVFWGHPVSQVPHIYYHRLFIPLSV